MSRDARVSQLIGKRVHNPRGENLGEIKDLIIDVTHQRVHYAVLSFGGILGVGNKLFAYPVTLFSPVGREDELLLDMPRDKLKAAPGFDQEKWPNWGDRTYRSEIERHFGAAATPQNLPNQRLVRASQLVGKDVDDATGRDAGEIEDVVVNLGTGRVRYAVLDFDKAWSPQDRLLAVPLRAFAFPTSDRDLVLNVPRDQLDMSTGFDENRWPDLNDPAYVRNVDRALDTVRPSGNTPAQQRGAEPGPNMR
ncbi:hypothetical protein AAW51_0816 [Caldimonas brevitalea]|uniref:PRC-barrel domain-containing protein n=1 Tax=Caldimonas brevitalea TaxID=413882 RepID=A0A0G3BDY7_9BURK|nr:hypothetical protein AAW51_0816 [Caldimonas brevitalea]